MGETGGNDQYVSGTDDTVNVSMGNTVGSDVIIDSSGDLPDYDPIIFRQGYGCFYPISLILGQSCMGVVWVPLHDCTLLVPYL